MTHILIVSSRASAGRTIRNLHEDNILRDPSLTSITLIYVSSYWEFDVCRPYILLYIRI